MVKNVFIQGFLSSYYKEIRNIYKSLYRDSRGVTTTPVL